jgi:hypothetical protein
MSLSFGKMFLAVFYLVGLTSCSSTRDFELDAKLKVLDSKLATTQTEIAKLKTEIATLQSRQAGIVCGTSNDALLVQSGDLSVVLGTGDTDVFYQRSYASPPELILPEELSDIAAKLIEQRANGFRIRLSRFPPGVRPRKWQARGIAASSCK